MGPQREGVEAACLAQLVEDVEVGVGVEGVVGVGRVVLQVPLARRLHVLCGPPLGLALIVHHVKAHHLIRKCSSNPLARLLAFGIIGEYAFTAVVILFLHAVLDVIYHAS